jgi:hypothetical protein
MKYQTRIYNEMKMTFKQINSLGRNVCLLITHIKFQSGWATIDQSGLRFVNLIFLLVHRVDEVNKNY